MIIVTKERLSNVSVDINATDLVYDIVLPTASTLVHSSCSAAHPLMDDMNVQRSSPLVMPHQPINSLYHQHPSTLPKITAVSTKLSDDLPQNQQEVRTLHGNSFRASRWHGRQKQMNKHPVPRKSLDSETGLEQLPHVPVCA